MGTDKNQMNRSVQSEHGRKHYPVVTRHDNNLKDSLNVYNPKSSCALNDPAHKTVQETFYKKTGE